MDGRWWEPGVSLLKWKVAAKQGEEARMTCGNGLELETSLLTHVLLNIVENGCI